MRHRDTAHFVGSLSVGHEGADLVLTGWDHMADDGDPVKVRVVVPAEALLGFIADVAREGNYALSDAIRQAALGDCGVCGNTGLVDAVGPAGRVTNVGCTACKRQGTTTEGILRDRPVYRRPDGPVAPEVEAARERSAADQRDRDARHRETSALTARKRPARR